MIRVCSCLQVGKGTFWTSLLYITDVQIQSFNVTYNKLACGDNSKVVLRNNEIIEIIRKIHFSEIGRLCIRYYCQMLFLLLIP